MGYSTRSAAESNDTAQSNGHVSGDRRFRGDRTCPVCHGAENDPRGQGGRCFGFLSHDGEWCHCSREEHAGQAKFHPKSQTFSHRLKGPCKCGHEHAPADQPPTRPKRERGQYDCHYGYINREGAKFFEVVRFKNPKRFAQRRPTGRFKDGRPEYVWNLDGVEPVLYELWNLLKSELDTPDERVMFVEGEKDVDRLRSLGFVATTNPMGAGKWRDEYAEDLRGRQVAIIPDNDAVGRNHAQQVARSVARVAYEVKIVELPGLPRGGDVSDYLDRGGTPEALRQLIEGTPPWSPANGQPEAKDNHETNGDGRNHRDEGEKMDSLTDEELGLTRLSGVVVVKVEWLWEDRIPLGKITLVAGEGGLGKSFMTLSWAAIVSRGAVFPDNPTVGVPAGHVIVLSAEDDLGDTVVPRLKAMGADLDRMDALGTAKRKNGTMVPFTIADIARLEEVVARRPGTRMIVIDPITAYLGSRVDDHKNAELRSLLGPLADFAARHRIAIIAQTHFNKSTGAGAAGRIIGSVAYSNAARATYAVAMDPENDGRRLFMPVKNNLSPDKTSMAYTITDGTVVWEREPFKVDVNHILSGKAGKEAGGERVKEAIAWLQTLLTPGPMTSAEVVEKAGEAGYGRDFIWKVKGMSAVKASKCGMDGGWMWTFNPPAKPTTEPEFDPERPY